MADETILHQEDVEGVIEDEIEAGVGANRAAIDDVDDDVDNAGATYAQAEINAIVTALNANSEATNAILAVLRANGIIDESEE